MKRVAGMLLLCATLLTAMAGCAQMPAEQQQKPDASGIRTFRDIPGMTEGEIEAIDELLSQRQSFTFGSLTSLDAFERSDGSVAGFVPLLCGLLTDLFETPFIPQVYDIRQLLDGINSYDIDFTGAINMPADMECHIYHSSPIAENKLSVFVQDGGLEIASEYDLRGLKVGFYKDLYTDQIARRTFPHVDYETVEVSTADEMAAMLQSGEIDAFICDSADVFELYLYRNVRKVSTFPHVHIPATISTANPQLRPIIAAITKYLMAGGNEQVRNLYNIGEHEYASYAILQVLDEEERAYIDSLRASGAKVPYGATTSRYPVAFYDRDSGGFNGIAIDVLMKISQLTGIEFYPNCDDSTTWTELEKMLETGEIKLLSQLIPNERREEYAIWPDSPYFTARYALLSNIDYPFLSVDQVPYATVGFAENTAEEARYKAWFPEATNYVAFQNTPAATGTDLGLDALERGEIDLFFSLDYTMLYESNYRENPNQKINILFDTPVEPVPFGLNKNETVLCSIISKSLNIINTDRIARSWTSRIFDQTAQLAEERMRTISVFTVVLALSLIAMIFFFMRSQRLKESVEKQSLVTLEANRNLQVLLDMAPVAIIISRRGDGTILYANKAGLDLYKVDSYMDGERNRRSFEFMPEIQPDGRRTSEIIEELWRHKKGVGEIHFIKQGGESFLARIAYCVISYNNTMASLNVIEDMTAEREHQRMLENIAQQEQEANQLKTRFLANMSHEIRTPMNAILGITEVQLQKGNLPAETEEALQQIHESGYLLLGIINDILDLSKIEVGKLEIVPLEYDFPSLVNDTVQLNRLRYDSKPIEFHLDIDPDVPVAMIGDELRLKQVLNNILSNAYKYTDEGEIRMSVSVEPRGDRGSGSGKDDINLIFTISDTGQGMTEQQLEVLFDEYTRFNPEANRATIGVGLGMSITKYLVELMGGDIKVASTYGEGTVFTVMLPQKRAGDLLCGTEMSRKLQGFRLQNVVTARKSRIQYEQIPDGNVLVVDDVKSNIYVTRGMLLQYGLEVDTASSGFEAIDKIDAGNKYDIIFMDHMMPKMNGIETTNILRGKGYTGCIIALTANALVGQAEVFMASGFDGYISKPIDSRELSYALHEFIRNKKTPKA